jgi:uncharacterized membrane protein
MSKNRLEAFSDGVIAIIITIMVLELKIPHGDELSSLEPLWPVFVSYIFSFLNIAIYWGNHHHLLHTVNHVSSKVIWANMHLLFWLSLNPFATAWMGENHFAPVTVAVYAMLQNMSGLAYYFLLLAIKSGHKSNATILDVLQKQQRKGVFSLIAYMLAIGAAFIHPALSGICVIAVAIMWWIPDRNIERL